MSIPRLAQKWELSSSSMVGDVSFDASNESSGETIIWKLDLPESPQEADQALQKLEIEIEVTQKALEEIPGEIERVGSRRTKTGSGELSFQTGDVPLPEAELLDLLEELSPTEPGLSFEIPGKSRQNWQNAAQEFENSLNRLKRMLTQFAIVETSIQGEIIGRTIVSWSGKTRSSWESSCPFEQYHLHLRSLQAALASRYLLLNMLAISAQGAAKLSALLAIPGGALMALPAVWKYITRIMDEIEKYQTLTRQGAQEWPTN